MIINPKTKRKDHPMPSTPTQKRINQARQITGYRNRATGETFESIIDASCQWYHHREIALIEKTPEPTKVIKSQGRGKFTTCFTKRAQPDYKGTIKGGQAIVFEAKHTDDSKITQSRLTPEQQKSLQDHHTMGAISYVLVSFGLESFHMIPWVIWKNLKKTHGRKYITQQEATPYRVPYKNGIIHFLQIADQ